MPEPCRHSSWSGRAYWECDECRQPVEPQEPSYWDADHATIADLRAELAEREAEVERLQSALRDHAECEHCAQPVMLLWRMPGQQGWTANCVVHSPARFPHGEEVITLSAALLPEETTPT